MVPDVKTENGQLHGQGVFPTNSTVAVNALGGKITFCN